MDLLWFVYDNGSMTVLVIDLCKLAGPIYVKHFPLPGSFPTNL